MQAIVVALLVGVVTVLAFTPSSEAREVTICVDGSGVGNCNMPVLVQVCPAPDQCFGVGHTGCGGTVCPPPEEP